MTAGQCLQNKVTGAEQYEECGWFAVRNENFLVWLRCSSILTNTAEAKQQNG
jgi:hypothetical protein